MSEQQNAKPEVPEGKTPYFVTRQKKPDEKGFVGYETDWVTWHKEVEYTTPKKP